jgi:diacylglycerol kinase (ATP)
LVRLFPTVFKGTHVDLDAVTTARVSAISIDSPGINAYADGDFACPLPATVTAEPQALQILVADRPSRRPGAAR